MGPTRKFVAISLSDQANDEGLCWPSVGSLMRRTGLSDRAIQQAIQFLESSGFMHLERREGRSTKFYLTPEAYSPPNEVHPEVDSPTPEAGSETPERPSPTPEPRSPIIYKNRQRISKEPTKAFMEFWERYPGGGSRGAAVKSWNKINPDAALEAAISIAIQTQIDERLRAEPGSFVPEWKNASTWLNQQGWLDKPREYKAPKGKLTAVDRVELATRRQDLIPEMPNVKLIR